MINEVCNRGIEFIKAENPKLLKHISTNFGFGVLPIYNLFIFKIDWTTIQRK